MNRYRVEYMFFKQGIKAEYSAVIVQSETDDEDTIVQMAKELAMEKEKVSNVKIGAISEL